MYQEESEKLGAGKAAAAEGKDYSYPSTMLVWTAWVYLHADFFFPENIMNVLSLPYNFLNNIFFFLAYFIVRIQYIIHVCVN